MSDVAAYHVFVCALFPVQGGMWTAVRIPPFTVVTTWNRPNCLTNMSSGDLSAQHMRVSQKSLQWKCFGRFTFSCT